MRSRDALCLAVAALISSPCAAEVRVIDGDTIVVDGEKIRLYGIDAPERHQVCFNWPCGEVARDAMVELTRGQAVACEPKHVDWYGRTVAICTAGGVDLGEWMVRNGLAWAWIRYSRRYEPAEIAACRERVGIWRRSMADCEARSR